MRIWLRTDISHCLIDAVNGISLFVRDLDAKFLLNCHNDFHGIEAVQAEVISEMRRRSYLQPSVRIMIERRIRWVADL